tara:strand:+ start:290 stop:1297 length:1008 start_codon:yes stop_codon:yes gene_type:complete
MSKAAELAALSGLTGRNVLINGNYDIWQRATSFTDTSGIWNYGFADRWNAHNDGTDAGTFSQSTTVPNSGSKYSLLLTGASSVTNSNLSQRIESTNLQGIRDANSLTVSGYVRSATAGKTIQFYGLAPNATDNFSSYTLLGNLFSTTTMSGNGSGGTIGIGLTDADTWYRFTARATNVNAQTNFDKGLALYISVLNQTSSSHQVYFSQLQMEAGPTATPFEHRSFPDELAKCQRYLCRYVANAQFANFLIGRSYNTTQGTAVMTTPVSMRALPTLTTTSVSGNFTYSHSALSLSSHEDALFQRFTIASTGAFTANGAYAVEANAADVFMQLDAEL